MNKKLIVAKTISNLTEEETKNLIKRLPVKGFYITGSLIRKDKSKDIDLISTHKPDEIMNIFDSRFTINNIRARGDKYIDFSIKYNKTDKDVNFNIWLTSEKDKNFIKFLHDYPRGYIISIRKKLKEKGYKLGNVDIKNISNNKSIDVKDVKKIFKLAGQTYRTPKEAEERH